MNIRLANAPVSWGVMEVEGWNPPLAPGTFLDELVAAGYTGTELGPYGFLPVDPVALGELLKRRGLAMISAFVPLRLKEPSADLEAARKVARLLGALGATHLVLADAMWREREAIAGRVEGGLSDAEWRTVAANVSAASGVAAEFGLRAVFHHHAGTYVETPEEIARLLDKTHIGLCLDTGHYVFGGGDPVEALRRWGARVEYLHFKDVDAARLDEARARKLGFLDAVRAGVFCPLGAGAVRFPELFHELDRIRYDGWAVVEQDVDMSGSAAGPTPAECARASRDYLRRWIP
jgi:inosose dehydratase